MSDNPLHFIGYSRRYYLCHPLQYLHDLWQVVLAFYQRGRYGYADRDCWDLCDCLAHWMPNALRHISKGYGYPGTDGAATPEEWQDVLARMIRGFEAFVEEDDIDTDWDDDELMARLLREQREGLELFVKWFGYLWD